MESRFANDPSQIETEDARPVPAGAFVSLEGEEYYRISAYHRMKPFLVSLASDSDLWMYVGSGGGLTAGRVDPDGSLFPYLTVDRLHDAHHHTGPLTLIRVKGRDGKDILWEPFSETSANDSAVERQLYKNAAGSRIVFEEFNGELGLVFRYAWSGCEEFGWVRTATLENRGDSPLKATLLDGLRNVLPHGAPLSLYQQSSNLVDAYKKTEVDPGTKLAIFSLTAGITDRAEALEVLRANTVWSCGLKEPRLHLSTEAAAAFRQGRAPEEEFILNGARGNYLMSFDLELQPTESSRWHIIADVGQDHLDISARRRQLLTDEDLDQRIGEGLRRTELNLLRNVASADGLQVSGHPESTTHHFANVLFNNMRGGVFLRNYELPLADFSNFLSIRNRNVARRWSPLLGDLPDTIDINQLRAIARQAKDNELERLCYEYLPLHFGRRHGDPSRPWNRFSIRARQENGERALSYEGNWRDIFQNWEALCTAFPDFLPSVIAKFVNASTVDGFNPYQINQDGITWEAATPDDPWSNLGYWGDHQIIYLLKLLEGLVKHAPETFEDLLDREIFSYAEVPYIIKPYAEILADSTATIDFDEARAGRIDIRVADRGTDGKLLTDSDGSVYHVNLLEKLLVPALSKLSNLILDAGIWMNTQRPEWNDANNALGGGGVSVVTLCHLRRYLAFLVAHLEPLVDSRLPVSSEVVAWLDGIEAVLQGELDLLGSEKLAAADRKRMLDALGEVFSRYRGTVYAGGFSGKTEIPVRRVVDLFKTALSHVEWGIRANQREDGLLHSYNLLDHAADGSGIEVVRLQEMLEGQVAALDSGLVDPAEALKILDRLYASDLFRPDQNSFLLYPNKVLPGFMAKNVIPVAKAEAIPLLKALLEAEDRTLIARDEDGLYRFQASFSKADDLAEALDALAGRNEWSALAARDREATLELFDVVFNHKSYMGRSGVMYGYEGLGCIYWHMVAKLLLAVQKLSLRAHHEGMPVSVQEELTAIYFRIRSGFGYEKSVEEFGAFPTDPYSHTSPGGSAKQPGMTGHVKEAILARIGELGVRVEAGTLTFHPILLRAEDFLKQPTEFRHFAVNGVAGSIALPAGSLGFTYCQVPVVYERITGNAWIRVEYADGTIIEDQGNQLRPETSDHLFLRDGRVAVIRVGIPEGELTQLH